MADEVLENGYPGIGRLHYFLAQIGMIAAVVFVITVFGPQSPMLKITGIAVMVVSFIVDVLRLRNIGLSQWFAFLRYVPFGKTILGVGLLSAQAGWAETRELDSAGRNILFAQVILIILILFLAFRAGVYFLGMGDFGFRLF